MRLIGKILNDRYKILEKIGEGGMATIYRAEDLRLGRKVAIKVLSEKLAQDPEILSRFLREAQSAARLVHPNIVNVYDIEESDGLNYIIMEYLEARSLKEIINRHAPFDIEATMKIFRQIAEAVKFAHENGIIHRDLKPQNVLVNSAGLVKVTDFGIARAITASSLTHTGTMMGTVQYFSPEQAQGKSVDRTADIYSLGIVLFEMLTGKLPFEGDNLVAIALKQVQEEPPTPSSFNASIPREIDRVILKALRKNPDERYQNMDEFLSAMESALNPPASQVAETVLKKPSAIDSTLIMGQTSKPPVEKALGTRDAREEEPEEEDEEGEEEESMRKRNEMPIYILVLVVFLFLATYALYKRGALTLMFTNDTIPDLVGMTVNAARQKVESRGWNIQIKEEVYHAKFPENTIISQKPEPGEKLARGGVITVTISKGATRVEVPNVVGLRLDNAKAQLSTQRLGWIIKDSVYSETIKKDYIISQDPPAGEEVAPGRKVSLVISLGSRKIEVPDLVGMTKERALEEVRKRGLNLVVEDRKHSSSYPEGQVISQKPQAGESVDSGAKILVVLSAGPEIAIAPDLSGKTLGEAMEMLSLLKIRIEVTDGTKDETAKIVGQDPPAGSQLKTKTVKVWCTEEVKVPNVIGKKVEDAQKAIKNAGLNAKLNFIESTEPPGTVLEQDPAPDVTASRDSLVTIGIAKKPSIPIIETPSPSPAITATQTPENTPSPTPGTSPKPTDSGVKIFR